MRNAFINALAAGALLAPATAFAQSPSTTRIETRPFYGATVTLEEGVRVFRPLPPHGRIIINPGGATPLNLSYEERRTVSHNYHYGDGDVGNAYAGASAYGDDRPGRRHGRHAPFAARGVGGGHGSGSHGGRR